MWQKRKAHHSQQSAQHSHPSSQTKQQQSAAKQASKHPLSFCCLTTTCWGGPWLDLLDYGACLTKEGCLGWVPDLLILHSVGKRLVSFLGRTRGGGSGRGLGHSRRRTEVVLADNTGLEEVRIAVAVELSASSFPQTSRPAREIYWITLGWITASILSAHILTPPPPPLLLLDPLKRVAGMPWR